MSLDRNAIARRLPALVAAATVLAAGALAGCGEKPEPAVHPPTAAPTTIPPATTTAAPGTPTKPVPTPTAPVPKTTP